MSSLGKLEILGDLGEEWILFAFGFFGLKSSIPPQSSSWPGPLFRAWSSCRL